MQDSLDLKDTNDSICALTGLMLFSIHRGVFNLSHPFDKLRV